MNCLVPGHRPLLITRRLQRSCALFFYLGTDTACESIKAIPCSSRIEWTAAEGVKKEAGRLSPPAISIERLEAFGIYASLLRRAVQSGLSPDSKALPPSGGRDSRHMLVEICSNDAPPDFCITAKHFPPRNNSDAVVAAVLCARLRVTHEVVSQRCFRVRQDFQ